MIFILNREGTVTETVTSPVYQGSNTNEVVVLAPFAPNNTVTVGFTLPNGLIVQPKLAENDKGTAMTSLPVRDLLLKVGETTETMSAWYCKINRDITRYSGTLTLQFFIYDAAGDILASSSTTVPVQKGVSVLDGTTFDASTAAQLQKALDGVYAMISSLNEELRTVKETTDLNGEMISTLQNDVSQNTTAITNIEAQVKEADASITNLESRISANEQNIDGLLGTTSELSQAVSGLDGDTKQLKSEIDALDARMYNVEDAVVSIEERVTGDENSITGLEARMDNAEGNIHDLKSSVSLIWTILENTVITVTTVEDTYNTRVTAGGLPVVDDAPATVHAIKGATAPTVNLVDETLLLPWTIPTDTTAFTGKTIPFKIKAGTYTVSNKLNGTVDTPNVLAIVLMDSSLNEIVSCNSASLNSINTSATFTVTQEQAEQITQLYFFFNKETTSALLGLTVEYFMLNAGSTALPHEAYYAGLKSATFAGITSTWRNLLEPSADRKDTVEGVTYQTTQATGEVHITGTPTARNGAQVFNDIHLPGGGCTLYLPHAQSGTSWYVRNSTREVASLDADTTHRSVYFGADADEVYSVYVYVETTVGTIDYTETPMLLPGRVTENFPAFETYHADTSFALATPVTLGKWDHIDVDAQKMIVGTATLTQETPLTDEQLAKYTDYVLSADGKTIAYESTATTQTAVTLPKTYKAWRGGCEYVRKDTARGQNPDNVKITVNQDYYEEVSNA